MSAYTIQVFNLGDAFPDREVDCEADDKDDALAEFAELTESLTGGRTAVLCSPNGARIAEYACETVGL